MIRYKQLITFKVIDNYTGEFMGNIFDVIYSDDYKKITHLVIKNKNLIKNKASISYDKITFLGNDQILYLNGGKIFEEKLEEDIKERFKYIDKEIKTENGECIGYVKDVIIDKEEGSIKGFIITEGVIEDLLKGRNYMPLFKSTVINDDSIYIIEKQFN